MARCGEGRPKLQKSGWRQEFPAATARAALMGRYAVGVAGGMARKRAVFE